MGNSIVSSVIRVFDRSHLEIESISAKIDRQHIKGNREKHEVYVENIGIFQTNGVDYVENSNNFNNIKVQHLLYKFINILGAIA